MNRSILTIIALALILSLPCQGKTQDAIIEPAITLPGSPDGDPTWEPTGVWPFAYQRFRTADVYAGVISKTKHTVPANIHLGKHTLWFSQNDTLLEAVPQTIRKVVFSNGDTYYPIGANDDMALVLREDTVNGRIARLYQVWQPDMRVINQRALDQINAASMLRGGSEFGLLNSTAAAMADTQDATPEERPLPMTSRFYFFIDGNLFEAKEKYILQYLGKSRRAEYLAFTRSSEIISTNAKSIIKVWDTFIAPKH